MITKVKLFMDPSYFILENKVNEFLATNNRLAISISTPTKIKTSPTPNDMWGGEDWMIMLAYSEPKENTP